VAPDVVRALEELAAAEPASDDLSAEPATLAAFREVLGDDPESRPYAGPAYRFPEALGGVSGVTRITPEIVRLVEEMGPSWQGFAQELAGREPCWAVMEDGVVASICFSARLSERAAEAGVETMPLYKGRGYAGRVVMAWAHSVRAGGRIPLYSTSWENRASRAVARKLGLIQYATDLSL
jgi:RimJ/RimL family protein N-acetyltransferase